MYKAKITSADKVRHQATNSDFLEVKFDIIDEKKKVCVSKIIGMNVTSTKDDVIKEVNKHIAEYERELKNAILDAERTKANANVKDIQDNLVGQVVEKKPVKTGSKAKASKK